MVRGGVAIDGVPWEPGHLKSYAIRQLAESGVDNECIEVEVDAALALKHVQSDEVT